ncbi:DDE Tnp4 domain-containing protein [Aphis craccivora]|uniref:DDE Tnp4 domain-containing protein n=1 Tax=Aphis craccivora TaxID=307492 RepID=A0A6G0VRC3_APHCR|nr:DDE Tnp4 domain-containing protein [Aphis craccivora]
MCYRELINAHSQSVFVIPCKTTNTKHVPSPLRNAFYKKTPSLMNYTNPKDQIRLDKTKYAIMFRKRIRTVNNTCVLNAKMTFRIKVQLANGTLMANVCSSGLNYHRNPDDNGLTNHVKGSDTVDMASPTQLNCGILQSIKSYDVVRKIRSEALTADDYDKDDFHDILLMCNDKENNFVQHVGTSSVHCYSKEQLDILKKLIKNQKSVIGYLDATGTLVRKINKESKRVLYYVLVVNVPLPRDSSITCPVVEMISSAHDIVAISQWLNV